MLTDFNFSRKQKKRNALEFLCYSPCSYRWFLRVSAAVFLILVLRFRLNLSCLCLAFYESCIISLNQKAIFSYVLWFFFLLQRAPPQFDSEYMCCNPVSGYEETNTTVALSHQGREGSEGDERSEHCQPVTVKGSEPKAENEYMCCVLLVHL